MRRWYNKLLLTIGTRLPRNWSLLCMVCVFTLIALLNYSASYDYDSDIVSDTPDYFSNYRRWKEQVFSDYLDLRNLGNKRVKEFGLCGKERENYVPCYNVTANLLAGLKDGEEFDRHCELSRDQELCLVRPPRDYKIPLSWPTGRDVVYSGNVKLSKDQFLSSGSMTKRQVLWVVNRIFFACIML